MFDACTSLDEYVFLAHSYLIEVYERVLPDSVDEHLLHFSIALEIGVQHLLVGAVAESGAPHAL